MANTIVEFDGPEGLTLTLKLYSYGSDTEASSTSCTQKTNDKGRYASTVTAGLTGWYHARIIDGSNNLIVRGCVHMRDDANIHYVQDARDPKGQELSSHDGKAQAGGNTSITLASIASSIDDFYNNHAVRIVSGTGVGQVRVIDDYNGITKVATVNSAWSTNPDSTSIYQLIGYLPPVA